MAERPLGGIRARTCKTSDHDRSVPLYVTMSLSCRFRPLVALNSRVRFASSRYRAMGKKKSTTPAEDHLILPAHASTASIVDTHTHLASTFELYRERYKDGRYLDVFDFLRAMYKDRNVEAIVDVWCEAPVRKMWKEFADSALTPENRATTWGGVDYWFVMGK